MPIITVEQFKTITKKDKSTLRGSMSKIDTALERYHQSPNLGNLIEIFKVCVQWMKKKESRSEFTTNKIGFRTNYSDQDFLQRRIDVKNLANSALNKIFQEVDDSQVSGRDMAHFRFEMNKMELLSMSKYNRPAVKPLEKAYALERTTYLKSGKTEALSGTGKNEFHKQASRDSGSFPQKVFRKDVDLLTLQDWRLLETLARGSDFSNLSGNVIYKKKMERLDLMVTPDASGKLVDSHEHLFSTPGSSYAMDRYGNMFALPSDHKGDGEFFNHSSFNAGNDVICAGEIQVNNGVITCISNVSGHYKPNLKNLQECVRTLRKQNVDLSQAQAEDISQGTSVTVPALTLAN